MSTAKAIKVSRAAKNEVASVTRIRWVKDKTNAMNVIAHAVCIKKSRLIDEKKLSRLITDQLGESPDLVSSYFQ